MMRKWLYIIILILSSQILKSQKITKQIIFNYKNDSTFSISNIIFDEYGNYTFTIRKNNKYFIIRNHDTIACTDKIHHSTVYFLYSDRDSLNKIIYFKNPYSTVIYGPIYGNMLIFNEINHSKNNAGVIIENKDKFYYYKDNQLLSYQLKKEKNYFNDKWIYFSSNGNYIYYIKDSITKLYVNSKLIDSIDKGYFNDIYINNNGMYAYTKCKIIKTSHKTNTIINYIVTKDNIIKNTCGIKTYGTNRVKILDNNGYYINEDECILVNGNYYSNLKDIQDIQVLDSKNFMFTFSSNKRKNINVNGKIYRTDFEEIYAPNIDNQGNFACYGYKKYHIYKYINGKKSEEPVSKYGVRALPLYINPNGKCIYLFKTIDSIYLYVNDHLFFPPISRNDNFTYAKFNSIISNEFYISEPTPISSDLLYLEYKDSAYIIFNGKLSNALLPICHNYVSDNQILGQIVAADINFDSFYLIQKNGNKKFYLIINNIFYRTFDNIDYIFSKSTFFDGKKLIFYTMENFKVYKYIIEI